jgi:AbrB family looped-hinge helix DNA binding protein
MATTVSLDKAGRLVLPKPLREKLRLGPGDNLSIESDGDQITLRPIRPEPLLVKECGIWVYNGAPSDESIPDMIDREREKRVREFF